MKNLIIITSNNCAAEFDYPIISIFNERLKNFLLLHGVALLDNYNRVYLGTNEDLEFTRSDITSMIQRASVIPDEEYAVAMKYLRGVKHASIDIIDYIVDILYEKFEELENTALINQLEEILNADTNH